MRASLDTNVIIHLYRAGIQDMLFKLFDDVFIYEQIRETELKNHGADVLVQVDADIKDGKIRKYTDEELKSLAVLSKFNKHVNENKNLYGPGDMGEVYAISLAQTLGALSVVTDDTKQGGPYLSLLQFKGDADVIMPFNFTDLLIIRYLCGMVDEYQTVRDFETINLKSNLKWSFKSKIKSFIRRFWKDPYKEQDTRWMKELIGKYKIKEKSKFAALIKLL